MLNVLMVATSVLGVAALLTGPYLYQSLRSRRRLHHRLEDLRRLRP